MCWGEKITKLQINGTLKTAPVKICLKEGAEPFAVTGHREPLLISPKVKEALSRMESSGAAYCSG